MSVFGQIGLLLWKNWLVQKRSPVWSVFELLVPAALAFLVLVPAIITDPPPNGGYPERPNTYTPFEISGTSEDYRSSSCYSATKPYKLFTRLYYSPDDAQTKDIMEKVKGNLNLTLTPFSTEAEMITALQDYFGKCSSSDICPCSALMGGVVLAVDKASSKFAYKIRLPNAQRTNGYVYQSSAWNTRVFYSSPYGSYSDSSGRTVYFKTGFLTLQRAIDASMIELYGTPPEKDTQIYGNKMADYYTDSFSGQAMLVLFLLDYTFLIMLIFTIRNVVHEKEVGLKEYMKVMGLRNWLQWVSHFVWSFMKMAILSVYMAFIFTIQVNGQSVLEKSSFTVLLVYFLILSAGIICYAFVVSVFFQSATPAMAVGGILYFGLSIGGILISQGVFTDHSNAYKPWSFGINLASLLVNNIAMAQGFQLFSFFETLQIGMQWKYLLTPLTIDESLTLGFVWIMLLVDMLICIVITWYVEAVYPGSEGVPQKPWFPFQLSYWCGGSSKDDSESQSWRRRSIKAAMSATVEQGPENTYPTIQIGNLVKVYKGGKVLAVNGLNIQMYPDQITALLGHNGAGKTTTMKILTGILPATSGDVFIGGYNLSTSLNTIRQQLGLCPQHNILYNMLTVQEHLKLFCKLKGRKYNQTEVDRLLSVLNIQDKQHKKAETLSGGMKRKLLVAIALIGGSEVVFLDEPTSGMDPAARHSMWEFLKQEKSGRTIILSTHYMEEADVLGDTIAILANGQLQCAGSSLFLKKHYGTGYNLTVVFGREHQNNEQNARALLHLIQSQCPDASLQSALGLEGTFILPQKYHASFGKLFSMLEKQKAQFNVQSFGVSITTMEDVFLRVGQIAEGVDDDDDDDDEPNGDVDHRVHNNAQPDGIELGDIRHEGTDGLALTQGQSAKMLSGSFHDLCAYNPAMDGLTTPRRVAAPLLWLQQLKGLLIKRFHLTKRYWVMAIPQLIVPLIFAVLSILVYRSSDILGGDSIDYADMPPLLLNFDKFEKVLLPYWGYKGLTDADSYNKVLSSYPNLDSVKLSYGESLDNFILGKYNESGGRYKVTREYLAGATFDNPTKTAFYQGKIFHSDAISLNLVDSMLLSQALGKTVKIEVTNAPLHGNIWAPVNDSNSESHHASQSDSYLMVISVVMFMVFGMAFLISSFVVVLVKERASGAKHLQVLSGVHQSIFWLSNLMWDMTTFMIPTLIIIILFIIFKINLLVTHGLWAAMLLAFILFGFSSLARVYLISFFFDTPGRAYVLSMVLCIIIGLPVVLLGPTLEEGAKNTWKVLEPIFGIFLPNFCLGQSLFYIANYAAMFDQQTGSILSWDKPGIGRYIFFFLLEIAFYWAMVMLGELRVFSWLWERVKRVICCCNCCCCHRITGPVTPFAGQLMYTGDEDVQNEKSLVSTMSSDQCPLLAKGLTKQFPSIRAVDSLSFHVAQRDCFGLLGVNGAGKTTTFEMLIGNQSITAGQAAISSLDIARSWRRAGRNLGYCPQFDALLDRLSGYETLAMFARLRGIPENEVSRVVAAVIESVGIGKYAARMTKTYSGGNKRRLSLGMALVGLPNVLLLDEPTTGVDPAARRAVWDILAQLRQRGIAIVLSSHSMEECDALCTRIAIMVHGQLVCIGSSQHLKSKYGTGYSLQLKVESQQMIDSAKQAIATQFPGSVLKEVHDTILIYELAQTESSSWSSMFDCLEALVEPLKIVDYSLSQTTLEQVFLKFSREPSVSYAPPPIPVGYDNPVAEVDPQPNSVTVQF